MIELKRLTAEELLRMEVRLEQMLQRRREEILQHARDDEPRVLRKAGVGPRYLEEDLQEELLPEPVRAWCRDVAASLRTRHNLVLCGPAGSGKTAAAVYCLRAAYRSGRIDQDVDLMRWSYPSLAFIRACDLFRDIATRRFELVETASKAQLIVLDDLGSSYEADFAIGELSSIFDYRWSQLRTSILTSNLSPDLLEQRYPLLWDRISENLTIVKIVRSSLRRKKSA